MRSGARTAVALCAIAAATLLHPTAFASAPPSKPLAFSILEDYDKGDDLDDVARDFALFHELGITT